MGESSPSTTEQQGIIAVEHVPTNGHIPTAEELQLSAVVLEDLDRLRVDELYALLATGRVTQEEQIAALHPFATRGNGYNSAWNNVIRTRNELAKILGDKDTELEIHEGADEDEVYRFSIGKKQHTPPSPPQDSASNFDVLTEANAPKKPERQRKSRTIPFPPRETLPFKDGFDPRREIYGLIYEAMTTTGKGALDVELAEKVYGDEEDFDLDEAVENIRWYIQQYNEGEIPEVAAIWIGHAKRRKDETEKRRILQNHPPRKKEAFDEEDDAVDLMTPTIPQITETHTLITVDLSDSEVPPLTPEQPAALSNASPILASNEASKPTPSEADLELFSQPDRFGGHRTALGIAASILFPRYLTNRSMDRQKFDDEFREKFKLANPDATKSDIESELKGIFPSLTKELKKLDPTLTIKGLSAGRHANQMVRIGRLEAAPVAPQAELPPTPQPVTTQAKRPEIEVTPREASKPLPNKQEVEIDTSVFGESGTILLQYLNRPGGRSLSDVAVIRRKSGKTGPISKGELTDAHMAIDSLRFSLPQGIEIVTIDGRAHLQSDRSITEIIALRKEEIIRISAERDAEKTRQQQFAEERVRQQAVRERHSVQLREEEAFRLEGLLILEREARHIDWDRQEKAIQKEIEFMDRARAETSSIDPYHLEDPPNVNLEPTTESEARFLKLMEEAIIQPSDELHGPHEALPTIGTEGMDIIQEGTKQPVQETALDPLIEELTALKIDGVISSMLSSTAQEPSGLNTLARIINPDAKKIKSHHITAARELLINKANTLLKGTGFEFQHPIDGDLAMTMAVWLSYDGETRPSTLQEFFEAIKHSRKTDAHEEIVIETSQKPAVQLTESKSMRIVHPKNRPADNLPIPLADAFAAIEAREIKPDATPPISVSSDPTVMDFQIGEESYKFDYAKQKLLIKAMATQVGKKMSADELARMTGMEARMVRMNIESLAKQLRKSEKTKGILTNEGNQRFTLNSPVIFS